MQRVDQMYVVLAADSKPLRAALKEANRAVAQAQQKAAPHLRQIDGAFTSMSRAATGAVKAMGPAAVAAIGGFFAVATIREFNQQVQQSIDKLDAIGKTADRLGLSTDALQELRHAAELSGVEVATFDMAMQRFVRRTAEAAQGTGEAKGALEELGIQLRDNDGKMKSSEQLFTEVSDALSKVGSQSDRVRLAFKLFDSEGVKLVNMMQDGSAAIDKMRQDARDLGLVFDEALIRKSTESKDKLDVLWKMIDADVTRTFADMADELVQIVRLLVDFVRWTTKASVELLKFFGVIDRGGMEKLLKERKELAQSIVNPNIDLVFGQVQLLSDEEIQRRRDRIAELDEQIRRANMRAATSGGAPTGGGGSFDGGGTSTGGGGGSAPARDPLAELVKNAEAQRRVYETLAMTAVMPDYQNLTDEVRLATQVVEQLGDAGLNLSERFANGYGGATDQVLAWMGVLDQASIATGNLSDRERELGERVAQEAMWREQLKEQYEEYLEQRQRDNELTENLATADLSFGDSFVSQMQRMRDETQSVSAQMGASLAGVFGPGGTFQRSIGNAAAQMLVFGETGEDAIRRIGQQILGSIVSNLVEMGVQMAINAIIGQTLGATATAASAAQAGALAAAWAPAAAMASLATLGTNSAAATAGVASTIALTKSMAIVSGAVPGFAQGGYTGDGGAGQIAGLVHAGEYVVSADATAKHRALLEQINAGMPALPAVPQMGSAATAGGAPQIQFNVVNEIGHLGRAEVDPRQPNTVRIRAIADQAVRDGAGPAAARDLRDPDSDFSKALGSLTTARRDR